MSIFCDGCVRWPWQVHRILCDVYRPANIVTTNSYRPLAINCGHQVHCLSRCSTLCTRYLALQWLFVLCAVGTRSNCLSRCSTLCTRYLALQWLFVLCAVATRSNCLFLCSALCTRYLSVRLLTRTTQSGDVACTYYCVLTHSFTCVIALLHYSMTKIYSCTDVIK